MNEQPTHDEMVEALAEYAHAAWSNWMSYMFRLMTPPIFSLVDESDFMRYLEFNAGYTAFNQGRGPGLSRNSRLGWLKAYHEDAEYLEERKEERREQ